MLLYFTLILLSDILCAQSITRLDFRQGSIVLLKEYKQNFYALSSIETWIKESYKPSSTFDGYIRIVGYYADDTDRSINHTAKQAATIVSYLQSKTGVKALRYTFQLGRDPLKDGIEIECIDSPMPQGQNRHIYFTKSNAPSNMEKSVERYPAAAYLKDIHTTSSQVASPVVINQSTPKQNALIANTSTEDLSTILFRHGSETLYGGLSENKSALASTRSMIVEKCQQLISSMGHIRLTALIPIEQRGNLAVLNLASIRASIVRKYLINNYSFLSDSSFTFFIEPDDKDNAIRVEFVPDAITNPEQSDIWYSLSKNYPEKVEFAMSHYKRIPFLDGSELFETPGMDFDAIDPILDKTATTNRVGMIDEKVSVTIYYRWDKDNLDKTYLNNTKALVQIDSLLTNEESQYIDSVVIVAYASPEGRPEYNKTLSQRRANTVKQYILANYPQYRDNQIVTIARGENWDGFRRMAVADPDLLMKEQVLAIIDKPDTNDEQRQSMIAQLDGGRLYKNYILPNYYRYLRLGASLFVIYTPGKVIEIDFNPINIEIIEPVFPVIEPQIMMGTIHSYPIALRTNLLYDAVGAINLGVELPYGRNKNWSLITDVAYAYWRSPKNLYALQTLEYGIENRYWLGVNQRLIEQKENWAQTLKGWYVGLYGKYWQRYDIQWIDGVQGDASWSAGITAGYAIPINRSLSFDFGIGAGWVSTSEYRHYHQPEYDENGKYYLMWQETGIWSGLSLTKVRFALVWTIQTSKVKKGEPK